MALTPSNMVPLGSPAPNFELLDVTSGKTCTLTELKSDVATVVMFICAHCPFVVHLEAKLAEVAKTYTARGIQFIGISSNDIETHPEDAPDQLALQAKEQGFCFPYLFDEDQSVAKAYHAACTPDFFIFDASLGCVYRGRFDSAMPGNDKPVTGSDLTQALDALLFGKPLSSDQKPSIGCNIKWR